MTRPPPSAALSWQTPAAFATHNCAAYNQLLLYRDALANPPLLVLCDLDRIIVRTNFTGTVSATHEIARECLGDTRNIEIMRAVLHDPEALPARRTLHQPRGH